MPFDTTRSNDQYTHRKRLYLNDKEIKNGGEGDNHYDDEDE